MTHASVVQRVLEVDGRPLRTGYVEAVATAPEAQGRGHSSQVMTVVTIHIRSSFQLGALGTGRHAIYERLGWRTWAGPSFVRTTPATPTRPALDWNAPISCDWRPGDVW